MVHENKDLDTLAQLKRRISYVVYHYKHYDDKYYQYKTPMREYVNYGMLKYEAFRNFKLPKAEEIETNGGFILTPVESEQEGANTNKHISDENYRRIMPMNDVETGKEPEVKPDE